MIHIDFSAFVASLPIIAQGMGGVFLVIAIIWGAIALLTKFLKN